MLLDKNNFVKTFNQIYPKNTIQNINGISIDSRTIDSNDIFIPFKGDSFDGHKFMEYFADVLDERNSRNNSVSSQVEIKFDMSAIKDLKKIAGIRRKKMDKY